MFTNMIDFKLTVLIINFQNKDIYYGNTIKAKKCKKKALRPT